MNLHQEVAALSEYAAGPVRWGNSAVGPGGSIINIANTINSIPS